MFSSFQILFYITKFRNVVVNKNEMIKKTLPEVSSYLLVLISWKLKKIVTMLNDCENS